MEGGKNSNKHYVVYEGREQGVFKTWGEAHASTNRYSGNAHQSFKTYDQAQDALNSYQKATTSESNPPLSYSSSSSTQKSSVTKY